MKHGIFRTLVLTTVALLASACSYVMLNDDKEDMSEGYYNIVISGLVSDVTSNTAISDIQITLEVYHTNSPSILPFITRIVKTDSRGIYLVEDQGFTGPITCKLHAESTENADVEYISASSEIMVNWNEESIDTETNTLYVNDHNFQLTRK